MQTLHQPDLPLPDTEAIRARIQRLSEEANLLRRLLRALNRVKAHQSHIEAPTSSRKPEVAHAAAR